MNGPSISDLYRHYGPNRDNGYKTRFDDTRKRWVHTDDVEAIHFVVPEDEALKFAHDEHGEGWGPTHLLMFANAGVGNRWFVVNLSGMTEEEIDAFQEMINKAIESGREVAQLRDKRAQEALHEHDEIHPRSYRPAPVSVDRIGEESEHD